MPTTILNLLAASPWALERTFAPALVRAVVSAIRGDAAALASVSIPEPEAATRTPSRGRGGHAVSVVPVSGLLSHRPASPFARMLGLGGTSYVEIAAAVQAADRDPDVGAIVLNVNSPGGSVLGATEAAAVIRNAATPVVAIANTDMASAAYWLAAGADHVIATPSARVGSIGVMALHQDVSKALEAAGVKVSAIASGAHKLDGHEAFELSDDARAEMQADVDRVAGVFHADVARGRGVSRAAVAGERFGEGRVFSASDAVARGLADSVGTLDDAVRMALTRPPEKRPRGRQRRAGATFGEIEAAAVRVAALGELPAVVHSACSSCDVFFEAPGVEALAAVLAQHVCQGIRAELKDEEPGRAENFRTRRRRRF